MGFVIIFIHAALLLALMLRLWQKRDTPFDLNRFIYTDGHVPNSIISISSFNTWMWTTSILGATEAGIIYGVAGCVSYAVGASLGFSLTLTLLRQGRRKYGRPFFISDMLKDRFSSGGETVFIVILVLLAAYTIVQQLVGVANVFSMLWGISYKYLSVLLVMFLVFFVMKVGNRGVLMADVIYFPIILLSLLLMLIIVMFGPDRVAFWNGFDLIFYDFRNNLTSDMLGGFLTGLGYYVTVMVIMGATQTVLDPTYYMKSNLIEDGEKRRSRLSSTALSRCGRLSL